MIIFLRCGVINAVRISIGTVKKKPMIAETTNVLTSPIVYMETHLKAESGGCCTDASCFVIFYL